MQIFNQPFTLKQDGEEEEEKKKNDSEINGNNDDEKRHISLSLCTYGNFASTYES